MTDVDQILIDNGLYEEAITNLKKRIQAGDIDAYEVLGSFYEANPNFIANMNDEPEVIFKEGYEKGSHLCAGKYARIIHEKDQKAALQAFRCSISDFDMDEKALEYHRFLLEVFSDESIDLVFWAAQDAYKEGIASGAFFLGMFYYEGLGSVKTDINQAYNYFKRVDQYLMPQDQWFRTEYYLARICEDSDSIYHDDEQALEHYLKAVSDAIEKSREFEIIDFFYFARYYYYKYDNKKVLKYAFDLLEELTKYDNSFNEFANLEISMDKLMGIRIYDFEFEEPLKYIQKMSEINPDEYENEDMAKLLCANACRTIGVLNTYTHEQIKNHKVNYDIAHQYFLKASFYGDEYATEELKKFKKNMFGRWTFKE